MYVNTTEYMSRIVAIACLVQHAGGLHKSTVVKVIFFPWCMCSLAAFAAFEL